MLNCLEISRIDALSGVTLSFWFGIFFLLYRAGNDYFFGRPYFVIALVAMLFWLVAVFLEIVSPTSECKILWSGAAWPMIVLLPTAWAFFLADYTFGARYRSRPWRTALLWLGPLAVGLVLLTNPMHGLFYGPGTGPQIIDGLMVVTYDHGPLFYVFSGYLYLFLLASVVVTVRGALLANEQYRSFFVGLLLVTLAPSMGNLLYIAFGVTLQGYDPTPFAFSVTLFILSLMIAQNRLMDVGSIAKDLLLHNAPDPIIVLDAGGRPLSRNPEARRVFELGTDQDSAAQTLTPELQGFIDEVIRTSGQPTRHTLTMRHRHFEPDIIPVKQMFGTSGTVIGWVLRLQDTTERRFLLNALQAERDYLSRLMETSMSGILALDAQGSIMFINAEAERLLGLKGLAVREISVEDAEWCYEWPEGTPVAGMASALSRILADQRPLRNRRLSLLRRNDGERRIVSINATMLDSIEAEARVVVSLTDVTDQYRTETNLRDAAAKSESENRSKSQFIANMSHEIRTPLNGVLGMAEVLDRLIKDPEQKRMITTIRHSGELLLTILNDVLDMSKIEAGKLELEATLFRPDHLASRIGELYAVAAEEKQIELEIYTSGRADVARVGDPHRVMQILQNLVSNAIKFTHEGEIAVTFSCPRGKPLVIEVRDSGIGMSPEQVERIFRAFEQADGSVTRKFGGTGLGMAIVAKIVEIMRGRIDVESTLGEGTTIRVTLPMEEG